MKIIPINVIFIITILENSNVMSITLGMGPILSFKKLAGYGISKTKASL